MQLLKDRYASLPPSVEKLYIAGRIHEFMTNKDQHYFANKSTFLLTYSDEEQRYIAALNHEKNKRFSDAVNSYLELYSQMKLRQDRDGTFFFEYHLCRLLNFQGNYLQSQNYCTQLQLRLDENADPIIPRHRILSVVAKNLDNIGDYKGALSTYKRLLDEVPEGNHTAKETAKVFNDIGILLCTLGQYQQALTYLYRALTLHVENQNDEGIAQTEHSLGEVYYHKRDLHQSISHFNKARLAHLKHNDVQSLAYVHLGLGKSYTELGSFHEGINQLLKGLDYATQYKDIRLNTDVVLALSNSYLQKRYYRQAEYYALRAKRLAEESQNIRTLTETLRQLAKIADKSGKYQLALAYYRQYVANEITIRDREHFKALEALDQSTSSLEQKLLNSELLARNEQLYVNIKRLKQEQRYTLLMILFLLMIIAYLVHKATNLKNYQQMDGLTNALHRTVFINKLKSAETYPIQATSNVVILFDIDNLKLINDIHGYSIGDQALKTLSDTVELSLNKEDFWGRLGGDEFMLVLRNVELYEVQQRVETLHKAVTSKPYSYQTNDAGNKKPLYVSTSFTFLATEGQISDFNQLYSVLDQALFKIKQKRQNCIFDACRDSIDCAFVSKQP
ncbi:MAG: diguanylate cyclase [Vibrio sp.]|uniref:diguanylate cyclase n=1 Tax=Vibrio sp. TaxID=678 RepID=UPI003A8A8C0D